MKILKIRLENLNSLRGEHAVAFDVDPLAGAGIFAITGQTGSGKSTLLDAITLALYGRAARYGDSSNPEDMMSRHTGHCQAEAEFEVPSGRYRAVWQLRRARDRPDGKLQPARRYLENEAGEILAEKINDVNQQIENLCGLDYHRFTRSVLLAQGEFANFLKAKSSERSELLEKLTGASIYSELGKLIHETFVERQRDLEQRQNLLSEITLLTIEERSVMEKRAAEDRGKHDEIKNRRESLAERSTKAKRLHEHLEAETAIVSKQKGLTTELEAAEDDLAGLKAHRKAQPFLPALAQFDQTLARAEGERKSAAAAKTKATAASEKSKALRGEVGAFGQQLLTKGRENLEKIRAQIAVCDGRRREAQDWLKVHDADRTLGAEFPKITEQLKALENARTQAAQAKSRLEKILGEIASEKERGKLAQEALKKTQSTLTSAQKRVDSAGEQLELLLAGKDEEARQAELDEAREKFRQLKETQKKVQRRPVLDRQIEVAGQRFEWAKEKREAAEDLLKSRREHLELAQRMASLDEHRAQLTPGEPCPLCGALEHPLADNDDLESALKELKAAVRKAEFSLSKAADLFEKNQRILTAIEAEVTALGVTDVDPDTLTKDLDECEKSGLEIKAALDRIRKKKDELSGKKDLLAEARENQVRADSERKARAESLAQLKKQREEAGVEIANSTEAVSTAETQLTKLAKPFGLELPATGEEAEFRSKLENRKIAFATQEKSLAAAGEELNRAQAEEKAANTGLTNLQKRAKPLLETATETNREWADFDAALAELTEAERLAAESQTTASEREKSAAAAGAESEKKSAGLLEKLAESSFVDPDALRAARIEDSEAERLTNLEKRFAERANQLAGQLKTHRESITELRKAETPEGEAREKLEAEKTEVEKQVEELGNRVATLREQLRIDGENRATFKERTASLDTDRARLKTWELLRGLIGDAKGKRFREYAQDISLTLLIRHANRHLSRLHERYRLRRCEGEKLNLEIEDQFQAGVTRPMESLSGGESFLASLALALGLSDLAGRNVQIDSLFIDEGFGSLDSDTLEIAISALEGLRQSNKMVGVISHVEILKERISTQIVVEKEPSGTSRLTVR
ncbi:MAG: exonuclease SbcC [Verrucomicrobiales bacterium]|jgi:exonuclease SbcC